MTGGGSSTVAFVKADGFLDIPGDPTYYLPGRNPVVNNLSLQNTLARLRTPDTAEAVDSLAGQLEGAFGISYAMSADRHGDVRDIVFNGGGAGFTTGRTALSRWYLGVEYLDADATSTVERVLKGTIPLEYQLSYEAQTNIIQESLTMGYADEERNTTITPSDIQGTADGQDVPFHGADLTVDSATVQKLQSATLSISNISRFHRANSRTAVDAVLAAPETTLDAAAIYNTNNTLELAYGSSGASSPQNTIDSVSGALSFDVEGTTVAEYTLPKLTPESYEWADLIDAETDLTDPVSYHVNGGVTVS